jgi:hypothetical protein
LPATIALGNATPHQRQFSQMKNFYLTTTAVVFLTWLSHQPLPAGSSPRVMLSIHTEVSTLEHADKRLELPLDVPPFRFFVGKVPDISHRLLVKIEPGTTPGSATLYFDPTGTRLLRNITSVNRNRRLAVLLNGRLIFSPIINATIDNGQLFLPRGVSPENLQMLQQVAKQNAKRYKNRPTPDTY